MLTGRRGFSGVVVVIITLFMMIPDGVRSEDKQNAVKGSSDVYTLGEVVVSGRADGVDPSLEVHGYGVYHLRT